VALQPENIVLMIAGITLGVLIGVLPGSAARTASPSCCR
jgi:TctA family transporter